MPSRTVVLTLCALSLGQLPIHVPLQGGGFSGEMRFSLSLFPGLFPRGGLGQPRLGQVLRLALGVGPQSQGQGTILFRDPEQGHGVWAGGLCPGTV